MRVIIEGPNGAGKTTLAKKLADVLGLNYHREARNYDQSGSGLEYYVKTIESLGTNLVIDRFHLGEVVYPELFNDHRTPLTAGMQHMLERRLLSETQATILVMVCANMAQIELAFKQRGDLFNSGFSMFEMQLFKDSYKRSLLPRTRAYRSEPINYSVDMVVQFLAEVNDWWHEFDNESQGLRSWALNSELSHVVVVGDQRNENKIISNRAFFDGDEHGCSVFLHNAIAETKAPHLYYLTNSIKTDGRLISTEEIISQNPSKIIALGVDAYERLSRIMPKTVIKKVKHPQYLKRFQNIDGMSYLVEALTV